jgi:hypothetical protein
MHLCRLPLDPVEQRLFDEQVVRALVVGRDAALVSPPEARRAPVTFEAGGQLVRRPGRFTAGQGDVPTGLSGRDEQDGRGALCLAWRV